MENIQRSKKRHEAESVAMIFSLLGIDPLSCDWSRERPDCLFTNPNGTIIGIEVVCCMNEGDDVLKMQNDLYKACKYCEKQLKRLGVSDLVVWVLFDNSLQRKAVKDHKFNSVVAEEIISHIANDRRLRKDELLKEKLKREGKCIYKYVQSVSCTKYRNTPLEVAPIEMFFLPDISVSAIENVVRKKEIKLKEYKTLPKNSNITEYWLMISIPFESYTQMGDLSGFTIQSDFSRIYITDSYEARQIK